ncbi:hypothetical protein Malapachy_0456 [Malassezia pachydermatis]|uniref:Up-regulated during septation protein 1 domain-containing protein n=1 Tax=Malassezia pachydermatis TaxID=77020 RepID=A0A0N0RRY8_9BASI|nr:hypothetical protein Malapachy_0456 [Malassezia pachydermatis]KOS12853.1 hypothetical protein Malapachy_0456 [Malassezia pachydermatis]
MDSGVSTPATATPANAGDGNGGHTNQSRKTTPLAQLLTETAHEAQLETQRSLSGDNVGHSKARRSLYARRQGTPLSASSKQSRPRVHSEMQHTLRRVVSPPALQPQPPPSTSSSLFMPQEAMLDDLLVTYSLTEAEPYEALTLEQVAALRQRQAKLYAHVKELKERMDLEVKMRAAAQRLHTSYLTSAPSTPQKGGITTPRSYASPEKSWSTPRRDAESVASQHDVDEAVHRTDQIMAQYQKAGEELHSVQTQLLRHHIAVLRDHLREARRSNQTLPTLWNATGRNMASIPLLATWIPPSLSAQRSQDYSMLTPAKVGLGALTTPIRSICSSLSPQGEWAVETKAATAPVSPAAEKSPDEDKEDHYVSRLLHDVQEWHERRQDLTRELSSATERQRALQKRLSTLCHENSEVAERLAALALDDDLDAPASKSPEETAPDATLWDATLHMTKAEHADAMASLQAQWEEERQRQQQAHDDLVATLASARTEHTREMERLQSEHATLVKELQDEHAQRMESLQTEHASSLAALQDKHKDYVNALQEEHSSSTQQLSTRYTDSCTQMESELNKWQDKHASLEKEVVSLRQQASSPGPSASESSPSLMPRSISQRLQSMFQTDETAKSKDQGLGLQLDARSVSDSHKSTLDVKQLQQQLEAERSQKEMMAHRLEEVMTMYRAAVQSKETKPDVAANTTSLLDMDSPASLEASALPPEDPAPAPWKPSMKEEKATTSSPPVPLPDLTLTTATPLDTSAKARETASTESDSVPHTPFGLLSPTAEVPTTPRRPTRGVDMYMDNAETPTHVRSERRNDGRVRFLETEVDKHRRAAEQSRIAYDELRQQYESEVQSFKQDHDTVQKWTEEWRRLCARLEQQHEFCQRVLGKADGREEMDGLLDQIKATSAKPASAQSRDTVEEAATLLAQVEEHIGDMAEGLARAGASGLGSNVIAQLEDYIEDLETQLAQYRAASQSGHGEHSHEGALPWKLNAQLDLCLYAIMVISAMLPDKEALAHSMSLPMERLRVFFASPTHPSAATSSAMQAAWQAQDPAAWSKIHAILDTSHAARSRTVDDTFAARVHALLEAVTQDPEHRMHTLLSDVVSRIAGTLDTSAMITERAIVLEDTMHRYTDMSAPVTPNIDDMIPDTLSSAHVPSLL